MEMGMEFSGTCTLLPVKTKYLTMTIFPSLSSPFSLGIKRHVSYRLL